MANYQALKDSVKQVIKTNGVQAITGQTLQSTLISIIGSVGANYQFAGIATTATNPGTPDQNVFYIAGEGKYVNFSNLTIDVGQLGILKYNGTWIKEVLEIGAGGGNMFVEWDTNETTTRLKVPVKIRKLGLIISYIKPNYGLINDQFIGSSLSGWGSGVNWEQIPNEQIIDDKTSIYEKSENTPQVKREKKFQKNDGSLNDAAGFVVYEYDVTENTKYYINADTGSTSCGVCFFGSSQNFISADLDIRNTVFKNKLIFTPKGCTKMRLQGRTNNLPYISNKKSFNEGINEIQEAIKPIPEMKKNSDWINEFKIYIPKTKNLYNKDNLLLDYTISNGLFQPGKGGICSNMILYNKSKSYTVTGVKGYSTFEAIFVAFFDENGKFIGRGQYNYNDKEKQIVTFKGKSQFDNAYYFRVLIKSATTPGLGIGGTDKVQIEEGTDSTDFVPFEADEQKLLKTILLNKDEGGEKPAFKGNVFLIGASFAFSGNKWFEYLCENYNLKGTNKAVSGYAICDDANKLYQGKLYTEKELEDMDILLIMHVHDKDVASMDGIKEDFNVYISEYLEKNPDGTTPFDRNNYAVPYDYLIKKYMADCYNLKNKSDSKYYQSENGKPCQIVFMTHWHDARATFNEAIRKLSERWGIPLVELDKNIGFSKAQKHSVTNVQISTMFCQDTEQIDGVTYGWHPYRDVSKPKGFYIQTKIANIVGEKLMSVIAMQGNALVE